MEESDANTESDEDYGEWTGFDRSSEADEDAIPPPGKPQEAVVVPPPIQPGSKYIPPHLRGAVADVQTQSSESLVRLTKHLKGLLNRYATSLLSPLFTLKGSSV